MFRRNALRKFFVLLMVAGCAGSVAFSQSQRGARAPGNDAVDSRDLRSGFGKPETISGVITAVDPRGLLILTRQGPGEPATTQLTVTESRDNATGNSQTTGVQSSPGPGQTDYTFRITASTKIIGNGGSKSAADLAGLQNRQATVHFVPRRSGNFAYSVDVGQ